MSKRLQAALLVAVVLTAAVAAAFLPSLHNGFAPIDDEKNLLQNPHYRGLDLRHLGWMFTTNHMGHYIPLTWITLGLDYVLWGLDPFGYHLTSLLFHLANALLFLGLAARLFREARPQVPESALLAGAVAAALAFAVHPLRVESVAWASERRDVVCGFFALLSVHAYLSAVQPGAGSRRRALAASAALFAAALLSKGIAIALPVALLALDLTVLGRLPPDPRQWRRPPHRWVLLEKAPYAALALISAVVTTWAIRYVMSPLASLGWNPRLAAAALSLTFYVQKTFVPFPLPPVVPRGPDVALGTPEFAVRGLVVIASLALLVVFRRRRPALVAAAVTYGAFVLPVSGLLQAGPQLVAHRYSYLSCLPWALLAGAAVAAFLGRDDRGTSPSRWGVFLAAGVLVAGGLVWLTRAQARIWRDPLTFATAAAAGAPDDAQPRYTLAVLHLRAGRWEEAARQIRIGLFHNPASRGLMNLAALLFATCPEERIRSREEAKLQALRLCRETEFRDPWALFALAAAMAEEGEYEAAAATAQRSRELAARYGIEELLKRLDAAQPLFAAGRPYRMSPAEWGAGSGAL